MECGDFTTQVIVRLPHVSWDTRPMSHDEHAPRERPEPHRRVNTADGGASPWSQTSGLPAPTNPKLNATKVALTPTIIPWGILCTKFQKCPGTSLCFLLIWFKVFSPFLEENMFNQMFKIACCSSQGYMTNYLVFLWFWLSCLTQNWCHSFRLQHSHVHLQSHGGSILVLVSDLSWGVWGNPSFGVLGVLISSSQAWNCDTLACQVLLCEMVKTLCYT